MNNGAIEKRQSWKEQYSLDIPSIDKQHMHFFKLFDKINSFDNNGVDYNQLNDYIDELEEYTILHFRTEEALMKKANFQSYDFHVEQHKLFSQKIKEFKIDYNYKNLLLIDKIVAFMRKWLIIHISEIDKQYVSSVKNMMIENNHIPDE